MEAPLIYKQIPRVMADIGSVSKDSKNEQQRYMFRGIEAFYQAAHPALIKHGVFCAPEVLEREETRFEKTNFEGKATTWIHVVLKVRHRFFAEDGSYIDVVTVGEGLDNSDKASNKALSGAMKYALIELFCVPTKDIEDSDRVSPEAGVGSKVVIERPVKLPDAMVEKVVARITKGQGDPIPVPIVESQYITPEQAGKIAMRFRESLRPELQSMAEALRHDALTAFKYIDKDGNPSSLMIPKKDFAEAGKKLVAYAAGL